MMISLIHLIAEMLSFHCSVHADASAILSMRHEINGQLLSVQRFVPFMVLPASATLASALISLKPHIRKLLTLSKFLDELQATCKGVTIEMKTGDVRLSGFAN